MYATTESSRVMARLYLWKQDKPSLPHFVSVPEEKEVEGRSIDNLVLCQYHVLQVAN